MRFLIITILSFLCIFQVQAEDNAVICEQEYDGVALDNPEILKLFRQIKQGVLGTVPKFCRQDNSVEQLKEKVSIEEDEMSKFVEALKKSEDLDEDVLKLSANADIDATSLVFNNLKLVVLKKMWNESTDEQKIKILISKECYDQKLNKYPIHKKVEKKLSNEKKELSLKNNLSVCEASNFHEIAPYLTNDVLAEALANIKTITPKNFNSAVGELCENLKKTDELIFKEDIYAKMGMSDQKSDDSSKQFSEWLKLLLRDDIKDKKAAKIKAEAYQKSLLAAKVKLQEQYAEAYEKGQVAGAPEKEVPYGEKDKVLIKKNGKYYLTFSSESWEGQKNHSEAYQKNALTYEQQNVKESLENQKLKMLEIYKSGQVAGEEERPVAVPGAPGYSLVKGDDGNIYYSLDPNFKDGIKKNLQSYFAKMAEKKAKEASPAHMQNYYKNEYDLLQGYPEWKLKTLDFQIVQNEDGTYLPVPTKKENDPKAIYAKELMLKGQENLPVPMFGWSGKEIIQLMTNNNGLYAGVSTSIFYVKDEHIEPQTPVYKEQPRLFSLSKHIDRNYQKRNFDPTQVSDLTKDEQSAISDYTGSGYRMINNCLRNQSCSDFQQKAVTDIQSGLKKIRMSPNKTDSYIVYRGTSLPSDVLDNLKKEPKAFVLDKGFMSTSGNVRTAYGFATARLGEPVKGDSAILIIKTKNCVGVSNLSNHNGEDEFLCPPGMKFNVKRQDPNSNVFILEDEN